MTPAEDRDPLLPCAICAAADDPGPGPACASCRWLLDWMRGLLFEGAAADGPYARTIGFDTTFRELAVESLDRMCWVQEAESTFGVAISDATAERTFTIGDYISTIRNSAPVKAEGRGDGGRSRGPMWDRQVDAG